MNNQLELRHLRYFLAVAETLHFGRAAAHLGMAQPPLSQQIKNLERIVGYRLFDRTTRGVRLTAVGHYLLDRAYKTLERVDKDVEMARCVGKGQEGPFRRFLGVSHVHPAAARYRALPPPVPEG